MTDSPPSWLVRAANLTPQQLARLTAKERTELAAAIEAFERRSERLADFIPRVTPIFASPRHLAPFLDLFERARRGERVRACVSAPPRHGKSESILHAFPWWFIERAQDQIAYVSYAAHQSEKMSRKARAHAFDAGLRLSVDTLSEWVTNGGGSVHFTGVDGPVLGRGYNLAIIDDPHKNRIEAESPRVRETVREWFKGTFIQRMEPGASVIVTHQRWHDEDLIGTLVAEGWEEVNLPAIREIEDPTAPDGKREEPLWPERWPLNELAALRHENEYNWWSQYMGSPRPRGGAVFRKEPARFDVPDLNGRRIVIAIDPAGTESTRADFTVGVAMAVDGTGAETTATIIDMVRVQLEPPDAAKVLRDFQRRNGGAAMVIESSRDGKAIKRMLEAIDSNMPITEVSPIGEKFLRAQGLASAWNDTPSRIAIPADVEAYPWAADLLAEFRLFTGTGDKHDDIVDACAYAWNHAAFVKPRFFRESDYEM